VSPNEILTTANDALLISCFGLAEEVDGRDPTHPGKDVQTRIGASSEVAIEKEDRSEEEKCQQSERISGVAPEERHGVG
jgi:hypothetical protein